LSLTGLIERALGLLPKPLHRAALRRAHALRKQWWRIAKPQVEACRILALDEAGRVLLVRHSYGPNVWMPPGGGMKRGEDPISAAQREFHEELGCTLDQPRLVAQTLDNLHGAGNTVNVIIGLCEGIPAPDQREIIAADFFAPDALPAELGRGLDTQIPLWIAPKASSN